MVTAASHDTFNALQASLQIQERLAVLDATSYAVGSPADFMESADALLMLANDKAVMAHRAIISSHSTVLCTMLNHIAAISKPGEQLQVPFADFTENETTMLMEYMYAKSPSFPSVDAALVVARFSHKFDAPDALHRAETFLISHMSSAVYDTQVNGPLSVLCCLQCHSV